MDSSERGALHVASRPVVYDEAKGSKALSAAQASGSSSMNDEVIHFALQVLIVFSYLSG